MDAVWESLKSVIDVEDGSANLGPELTPQERQRIAQRKLKEDQGPGEKYEWGTSEFYIAETDEEREKNAPSFTTSDIEELRVRAVQSMRKNGGIFQVHLEDFGDWFVNAVPKETKDWTKKHPMVREVMACVQPIILSRKPVLISWLQQEMQKRGAFMIKVRETPNSPDPSLWDLVFLLDLRFYAFLTLQSSNGRPQIVHEKIQEEKEKIEKMLEPNMGIRDRKEQDVLVKETQERRVLGYTSNEAEEEAEEEEERMEKEEEEAKDAKFKLAGVTARVISYNLQVV